MHQSNGAFNLERIEAAGRHLARLSHPAYPGYALTVLTTVYMFHLVDRYVIAMLSQPIAQDLHLNDTQIGVVTGIAFGVFYAVLGVPIARLADRRNRVNIIAIAIGLWGLTVMGSLLVRSFAQLVIARILAAVGEAGCKAPTYSLVGDYFVGAQERTRALSFYVAGSSVSEMLSYMLGG